MAEFTIHGVNYRSGKIDAFKQFHVARRLGTLLSGALLVGRVAKGMGAEAALTVADPLIEAFGKMKDEDVEYVLHTCLEVVVRQNNQLWAKVFTTSLMFEDIGMPEMCQIAWNVLQENFRPFVTALHELAPSPQGQNETG